MSWFEIIKLRGGGKAERIALIKASTYKVATEKTIIGHPQPIGTILRIKPTKLSKKVRRLI
jgi:hypothetical protein